MEDIINEECNELKTLLKISVINAMKTAFTSKLSSKWNSMK